MNNEVVIRVENLYKEYRLGTISHGTLYRDLQSWWARMRGREDPNSIISSSQPVTPYALRFTDSDNPHMLALNDVSFEVKRGEVLGIIGRNGAGKSTLLKILSEVASPTKGTVKIKGRVASLLEVGTGFHPELTGRENIYLNGAILGMTKKEIGNKFDEIVAFAEIEKFIDTPVKRYSSGMYVRLAFAVAAHLEPEILIVDEVLAVGDAQFQKKCLGKMGEVAKEGRTILFVSHSMPAIQRLCNKAIMLERGKIVLKDEASIVIDAYYKNTVDKRDLIVETRKIEIGSIGFYDWHMFNNSKLHKHSCYSGDPCTFSLKLESRREVKDANFGLAIWDKDGSLIWAMSSLDNNGHCVSLQKGLYELKFQIPSLPLRPNNYQILVSVNDLHEGTLDAWYAQPKLTILTRSESGLPPQWQGLLNINGKFSLSFVSEDVSTV